MLLSFMCKGLACIQKTPTTPSMFFDTFCLQGGRTLYVKEHVLLINLPASSVET